MDIINNIAEIKEDSSIYGLTTDTNEWGVCYYSTEMANLRGTEMKLQLP